MHVEKFDFVAYLAVIAITIMELMQLDYGNANVNVVVQFLIMGTYFFIRIVKHKTNISIFRMVYIFCYIFFFMAPIQQYTSGTVLWRSNGYVLNYTDSDYIKANLAIMLFMLVFDMSYHYFCKRRLSKSKWIKHNHIGMEKRSLGLSTSTSLLLLTVSILAFMLLVVTNNLTSMSTIVSNSSVNMQLQYILRFIPVVCLMVMVICYESDKGFNTKFSLVVYTIECVIIFFPLWGNMARFFLLGSYVVVFSLFFANRTKKKSLLVLLFVVGFCFAFSDLRYITSLADLKTTAINFNHVDFDAYQMLMGMMHYVKEEGISFGQNIISALAFLIPRELWAGKLEASGAIVISYYGSWFKNVSMPLVAEAFFAFEWIGLIAFALIFAKLSSRIDEWSNEINPFKRCIFCLIAGMSIYIMRGALLAAFAFVFGILLAIIFICTLCKTKIEK